MILPFSSVKMKSTKVQTLGAIRGRAVCKSEHSQTCMRTPLIGGLGHATFGNTARAYCIYIVHKKRMRKWLNRVRHADVDHAIAVRRAGSGPGESLSRSCK